MGGQDKGLPPIDRFMTKFKVDEGSGCWVWTASHIHRDPELYGLFWAGRDDPEARPTPGGRYQMVLAHRWSYRYFKGAIPPGLVIMHSCDRHPCVNPDHLSVGTYSDNTRDAVTKGRWAPKRRGKNGRAKLTEADVADIRAASTGRHGEGMELARRYGVASSTISRIILGRGWVDEAS